MDSDKTFKKELLALAIPIGLQNLLTVLIGASDALMLGRLTQDSVSAVSLANQISFVMMLFCGAVVGGGGTLLAQYWGKGDKNMVKNLFAMMVKWVAAIEIVFFVLTIFFPDRLMLIFTPDAKLISIGSSYLQIVGFSYLFLGISQCYFVVMKLEGKATKSVTISVIALVADMVIDFFLIYGIAGAPKLGANGSAVSTVFVEFLALAYCVYESFKKDNIHFGFHHIRWNDRVIIRDYLKVTLPILGSSLAWGLSISMHSFMMGHLGTDATAAASIAGVALEMVTCVCKGISAGAAIMIGKVLGQGLYDKAKEYGKRFCHLSFKVGGVHAILLAMLGPFMVKFFVLSHQAKLYLVYMLLFAALYVIAYSINTIVVCGIFQAGGDTIYDMKSVFFATWCFAIPLSLAGLFIFKWNVMIVYIIMCSDEIVKIPFVYPRYKKYLWVNKLTRD
ncbi:MAG: MATE family efflux transporter [Holdemanella sp.]|nr:MATE family efflux transporter [Holdemanella sp.]